jgi:hypothetical protein
MSQHLIPDILAILVEGQDMAVATTLPDGAPHAVTVSYASDGLAIYFGCSPASQKARNLVRDDRVAVTVTLPYRDWSQIRGLSLTGRARPVALGVAQVRVAGLFAAKFNEIAQYVSDAGDGVALFEVTPEIIGVLDYRKGFGHVEHVRVLGLDPPRTARLGSAAAPAPPAACAPGCALPETPAGGRRARAGGVRRGLPAGGAGRPCHLGDRRPRRRAWVG